RVCCAGVETWPSGRRHFPAKEAYGLKPVSRVRIPPSPPSYPHGIAGNPYEPHKKPCRISPFGAFSFSEAHTNPHYRTLSHTHCVGIVVGTIGSSDRRCLQTS